MVLKKVAESSGSAHRDRTEKQPTTGVNEVRTTALSADVEMNQKRLVSVHMDQKRLVLGSLVVGRMDRSLQLNEERVRSTMALEAAACKAYNGLRQQILELSVVLCEDQMVKESSVLSHMDRKLLHVDSLASACTCLH